MKKAFVLLGLLLLAGCYQTLPSVPHADSPQVLGIGSIDVGVSADGVLETASFESGYANIPDDLIFTSGPVSQLTPGTANGVSGQFVLTRVNLRNISDRNLENLTLLGVSLAERDQSLTPYSNVLTMIGTPVSDAETLYDIKPSQPISQNGITNASFVAFAEDDLDSDLRDTVSSIPDVSVAAIFPYGFRVGDVEAGQDATVDIGFFIPDGNPVGRFSFRFVAVTDTVERVTQGIDEINVSDDQDSGYDDVRQRFGNVASNKTLVLIGPFEREVSQEDFDSGIFTLLPDIRIAGTVGSLLATLFDSGSTVIAQVSIKPPTINLTSAIDGTTVTSNVLVSGSIDGQQTIINLVYTLNASAPVDVTDQATGTTFVFTIPGQDFVEGSNTINIEATNEDNVVSSTTSTVTYDPDVAPLEGSDIIVLNDLNPFVDPDGPYEPNVGYIIDNDVDNSTFFRNLISFPSSGRPRDESTVVAFDRGRNSRCTASTSEFNGGSACQDGNISAMLNIITEEGFNFVELNSQAGTLVNLSPDIRTLFLWLPRVDYTTDEINALKRFAAEGGRIVFIGEREPYYLQSGFAIQNRFLENMGANLRNIGGDFACDLVTGNPVTISSESIVESQITTGVNSFKFGCSSAVELGPNDYALFYDTSNQIVLSGVATINVNAISE